MRALAQISVAQICEGPIGERRVCFDAVQVRAPTHYNQHILMPVPNHSPQPPHQRAHGDPFSTTRRPCGLAQQRRVC
jgi:hypothetical protein